MPDSSETFRFGDFELDVSAYGLRRRGVPVKLERQPMDLLILLVERRQQLVSRSDIVDRLWGKDVFIDVETGINTAIRKIRHVLDDAPETPGFVETISGKGYRFIAPVDVLSGQRTSHSPTPYQTSPAASPVTIPGYRSSPAAASEVSTARSPRWDSRSLGGAAIGIAIVALAGWWFLRPARVKTAPVPPMRVVQLTALSGFEIGRVSADGRQVVFEWEGERQSNRDIYVQLVDSSDPHRLTTDPADDVAPFWSSDGRQIAYVRRGPDPFSGHIRVMSSLGGGDRQVSDFPVLVPATWSPDNRYLVAGRAAPTDAPNPTNGLYLIPVQGGEPRILTRPLAPGVDRTPTFSPDGHRLAYLSCDGPSIGGTSCHINVVAVDAGFVPVGSPRQVPHVPLTSILGLAWSSDGESLIFGAADLSAQYLWRVGVDADRPPDRIEIAGVNALFPSITAVGDRLVFTRFVDDTDIYRFEVGKSARPVAPSSVFDDNPEFSPNGQRIAFSSARLGTAVEVWVASADGSEPAQLTHGPGRWQGSPAWSPDGRHIAFESQGKDGSWHIWTVNVQSGLQQQITTDQGDQNMPTWSHDGDWIYFSWKQGNTPDTWQRDIWRVPVRSGSKEQVTRGGGGYGGRESADGKALLYQPALHTSPVMAQPLAGGPPSTLIACAIGSAIAVSDKGIYYLPCPAISAPGETTPIRVLDPKTGKDREVGKLEQYHGGLLTASFAVAPDGKTILYSRTVSSGADLMMIENFR
jgi:Tol biopolymer transport system component/DNA-binding winged helix-turn-helix (wHTH) protein